MNITTKILKKYGKLIISLSVIFALFWFSRLPALSINQREEIASRFEFTGFPLPELINQSYRQERQVNPSIAHHSGWISAVGASVALNDLDGDGLSNDVCYVETRSDQVIVAPIPTTGDRYQPFTLGVTELPYNAETMAPMGCLPADMNEDGAKDILVYYWGRTPVAFIKQGNSYVQQEITHSGEKWYTNAATFSDLDGDGHQDLIIGNYFQDNAEILDINSSKIEQMQDSMTRAFNAGKNRIFLWSQNPEQGVKYQEVLTPFSSKIAHAWTLAVGTADLDGDFLPEIYFANDFGPDRLLHNQSTPGNLKFTLLEGEKHLTTANSKVLGHDSFKGMGVDFGDINNDGLLDIYVSNIASEYALEESHFLFASTGELGKIKEGIAPYVDVSESLGLSRSGWGWETKLADFDNDGELEALQATGFRHGDVNRWPELQELAMSNDELLKVSNSWFKFQDGDDLSGNQHNPFFVKAQDGRYYDFAQELNLDQPFVTRGIATADVDGDGDLDFVIANQWEDSYFFRNDSPKINQSLDLKLVLQVNNNQAEIPAIGAIAKVQIPNGHSLITHVDGGNGHSGARSPELHFGLGETKSNISLPVEVQWRDLQGEIHTSHFSLLPGNHTLTLTTISD